MTMYPEVKAETRRVVVVGHGMAGSRVVAELLAAKPELDITVYGAEPHVPYNRVLLSNLVAGKADEQSIQLLDAQLCGTSVKVNSGVTVTAIDRESRTVCASDGSRTPYDALVLATGATAARPPLKRLTCDDGELLTGVVTLRTLDDCREILRLAAEASERSGRPARALVLGGGLLGLEVARGLVQRGHRAEVLQFGPILMERQLDEGAARALHGALAAVGVEVRLGTSVLAVAGRERFQGVECEDGGFVPGDLLVLATGMRPDTALAAAAGLPVGRGVVVDDLMRTADPAVFAVGDCAEHRGVVHGLVQPAWEQARVAAQVIAGVPEVAPYRESRVVTRLKTSGIDLASMGEFAPDGTEDDTDVVVFQDTRRNLYQKVVVRDCKVAGAVMVGESATLGTVTQLFDRHDPVPRDRRLLLFPLAATAVGETVLPDDALVCHCNAVTKAEITAHRGSDLASVARTTRATTGCGGCREAVAKLLES
ncbi:FAD-dependent oxidoreductase [Kitasatospora sp. NPDC002227]|uniref:FAD-dependent oxidoreductase n=1 Tax=Kitasatospora sp. NPDC002227 TaxID=3154773 RepID=UPI00332C8E80